MPTFKEIAQVPADMMHGAARLLYEQGRMKHLHTSWQPAYLEDATPHELKNDGFVSVALPFQLENKHYPAMKSEKVLQLYDPDYPHLVLSFEDPHKKSTGDEVLRLEPKGDARNVLAGQNNDINWRLYMPGTQQIIMAGNGGSPVSKPQAEMTAGDVVDMFINRIDNFSKGRLHVHNGHLHQALRMISEKSPALLKRWEILDQRLEFQNYLMYEPHQVAAILRSMVSAPPQEFAQLVDNIESGQITGWGTFLKAVDSMPNLTIKSNGAIMPLLIYSGYHTVPNPDVLKDAQNIPASIMISLQGLQYFNTLIKGKIEQLTPIMDKAAKTIITTQAASLSYVEKFGRLKTAAWNEAASELSASSGNVNKLVRQNVQDQLARLREEINAQMGQPQLPPNGNHKP